MDSIASELEARFWPALRELANRVTSEFPAVKTHTHSLSVGKSTEYQGWQLELDCLLPDADWRSDTVGLIIGLRHLTTEPELDKLEVGWGDGGGPGEVDLLREPVTLNPEAWNAIEIQLSVLSEALRSAIAQGLIDPRRAIR
jgi:hypothetical protein